MSRFFEDEASAKEVPEAVELHPTALLEFMRTTTAQLAAIEAKLSQLLKKENMEPQTTENGHGITKAGKKTPWKEVPSDEMLLEEATRYQKAHGAKALKAALQSLGVARIGELSNDQKQVFLERISDAEDMR